MSNQRKKGGVARKTKQAAENRWKKAKSSGPLNKAIEGIGYLTDKVVGALVGKAAVFALTAMLQSLHPALPLVPVVISQSQPSPTRPVLRLQWLLVETRKRSFEKPF